MRVKGAKLIKLFLYTDSAQLNITDSSITAYLGEQEFDRLFFNETDYYPGIRTQSLMASNDMCTTVEVSMVARCRIGAPNRRCSVKPILQRYDLV